MLASATSAPPPRLGRRPGAVRFPRALLRSPPREQVPPPLPRPGRRRPMPKQPRCCPRRANRSPRPPAYAVRRCRRRASRSRLLPGAARVPPVPPAAPAPGPDDRPVAEREDLAVQAEPDSAARAPRQVAEPVVLTGVPAPAAAAAPRVAFVVAPVAAAPRVEQARPEAERSAGTAAVPEGGAQPAGAGATSRSSKRRRSPTTRRRTLPFPTAR